MAEDNQKEPIKPETDEDRFKAIEGKYENVLRVQVGVSAIFGVLGGTVGIVAAALDVRGHGYQATFSGSGIKVGIAFLAAGTLVTHVTSFMKERTHNRIHRLRKKIELKALEQNFQSITEKLDDIKSDTVKKDNKQVVRVGRVEDEDAGEDCADGPRSFVKEVLKQSLKPLWLPNLLRKRKTYIHGLSGTVEAFITYYLMKTVDEMERRVARAATGMILVHLWTNQLHTFIHTAFELYDCKEFKETESQTNRAERTLATSFDVL